MPSRFFVKTDLYGITRERVEEQYNIIDRDCLSFWLYFRRKTGLEFGGSAIDVFWMSKDRGDRGGLTPYIPYRALTKAIKTVLNDTAATCRAHALPPDKYIDEAAALLLSHLIDKVYAEMVRLECRLRKIAHQGTAFREWEVKEGTRKLSRYVREQADAAKLLGNVHVAPQRQPNALGQMIETAGRDRRATKKPSVKDRFTFGPGQVLFDGKDLELPSDAPVAMLKNLVDNFGRVVPYTDFDPHYTSATPGTVHKCKREIVKSFAKHKVPCEITFKTGVGYFIRRCTSAAKRKKRVRRK